MQYNSKWKIINTQEWQFYYPNFLSSSSIQSHAKVAVVSYDNRENSDISKLRDINANYCKKRGYDFYFFNSRNPHDDQYPPYWLKVKLVYDVLLTQKYDIVMWIDSDACVHNHDICVEKIFALHPNACFVASPDPQFYLSKFNAGVWIVKNNDKGKEFLETWLAKYDRSKWKKQGDVWNCKSCAWAGMDYEQGSGLVLIWDDRFAPHVLHLPSCSMQEIQPEPHAFTLHFMAHLKKKIKDYRSTQ